MSIFSLFEGSVMRFPSYKIFSRMFNVLITLVQSSWRAINSQFSSFLFIF